MNEWASNCVNTPFTIECQLEVRPPAKKCKELSVSDGIDPFSPAPAPRIARLMALALRFDGLVQDGTVADYTELARLGYVTVARISQIMNLLYLAPDLQETLLFLPAAQQGRDRIHLRLVQPIASLWCWKQQRRRWQEMLRQL